MPRAFLSQGQVLMVRAVTSRFRRNKRMNGGLLVTKRGLGSLTHGLAITRQNIYRVNIHKYGVIKWKIEHS